MFNGQIYISQGFEEEIPLAQKGCVFEAIELMSQKPDSEVDYLQKFEMMPCIDYSTGIPCQMVVHTQDDPEYRNEYFILVDDGDIVSNTVFVVDEGDSYTCLLAREY